MTAAMRIYRAYRTKTTYEVCIYVGIHYPPDETRHGYPSLRAAQEEAERIVRNKEVAGVSLTQAVAVVDNVSADGYHTIRHVVVGEYRA